MNNLIAEMNNCSISEKSFTPTVSLNKVKYNNHSIIPSSYRMVICGRTGSGKTTLLLKLILLKKLDYEEIFIFCPTTFQIEYQIIINAFNKGLSAEHIVNLFNYQKEIDKDCDGKPNFDLTINRISEELTEKERSKIKINVLDHIPNPEEIYKPNKKIILILDDVIAEGDEIKSAIGKIFTTSRPYGFNVILLTQSFMKCDKQFIREQANVWMIFKESATVLKNIREQKTEIDFPVKKDFFEFANNAWTKTIDGKERDKNDIGFFIMVQNRNENNYYNGDALFDSI
jgi:energy-coupling factor transporter ATP-binding protein EcfA2